jgi:3-deoxy-D-manno-octulosonic-acid transferase
MLRHKKYRAGLKTRFGKTDISNWAKDKKIIWIHAVSVGESKAAAPLISFLKKKYPDYSILVSTVTDTGQSVAKTLEGVDRTTYLPIDLIPITRKVARTVQPKICLIMETEIWPSWLWAMGELGIPTYLINGRISDKSFPNYKKAKWFLKYVLPAVTGFGMQSETDGERIKLLGASPEKVKVLGNLKFDSALNNSGITKDQIREKFGIPQDRTVIVGGSTFPGEEKILLDWIIKTREKFPSLLLFLVPRHPERWSEVIKLLESYDIKWSKRSDRKYEDVSVILLDTMGELSLLYGAAEITFIGKSLTSRGGQNPLEPAAWGNAICFGPYMDNFRDIAESLKTVGGAVEVKDIPELYRQLDKWVSNGDEAEHVGQNALNWLHSKAGVSSKIIEWIKI